MCSVYIKYSKTISQDSHNVVRVQFSVCTNTFIKILMFVVCLFVCLIGICSKYHISATRLELFAVAHWRPQNSLYTILKDINVVFDKLKMWCTKDLQIDCWEMGEIGDLISLVLRCVMLLTDVLMCWLLDLSQLKNAANWHSA